MQRQSWRAMRKEGIRCQKPQRFLGKERKKAQHDHTHEHWHELELLNMRYRSHRRGLYRLTIRSHTTSTDGTGAARQRATNCCWLLRPA